jgi:hypothetical protein
MTARSKRTALLPLEGVESLTAFGFERVGLGLMLTHNEGACDEGEDAEEEGDHGVIQKGKIERTLR